MTAGGEAIDIYYRTEGKALPPRAIRLSLPGWAGMPNKKMEHGSEPQPWHCRPFVQGATQGLELVYQYEVECHIINEGGQLRIDWDYSKEPGGILGVDEFGFTEPRPPQFYTFATSIDLQAPSGYVLQTQPHPRYFTDQTGTVPLCLISQIQSHWWPKKLFAVFKVPPAGSRHIFKKGEPYLQIIFIPAQTRLELRSMPAESAAKRKELEDGIIYAKAQIAKNAWLSPSGGHFDDHYKVLERAFSAQGHAGVEEAIKDAVSRQEQAVPKGLSFGQYLELARQHHKEGKYLEARDVYFHMRTLDRNHPDVADGMGTVATALGLLDLALGATSAAAAANPRSARYRAHLGHILRKMGRHEEAQAQLHAAISLDPVNADAAADLGLALACLGQPNEGLDLCRSAVTLDSSSALVQLCLGEVLVMLQRPNEARAAFEAALNLNSANELCKAALAKLKS